jgi:TonB family protein
MPDHKVPEPKFSNLQGSSLGGESDLGELAALFAAHGGGGLSAEISADLALEIVLNEIVEQACLATGATGAAIVLVREGEMVCRASSGANAPELGAPLSGESGLTAECIRTRQVQRCDDAQADPRADAEASRSLGVRSVMILPLLTKGELVGILEVFSPRAGAFGDRDELTLEALARRILKNMERASEPLSLPGSAAAAGTVVGFAVENPPAELGSARPVAVEEAWEVSEASPNQADHDLADQVQADDVQADHLLAGTLNHEGNLIQEEEDVPAEIVGGSGRDGLDVVTLALGAAVVACAVLLGTLVGVRFGWRKGAAVHGQVTKGAGVAPQSAARNAGAQDTTAPGAATQAGGVLGANAGASSAPSGAVNAGAAGAKNEKKNALEAGGGVKDSAPQAGGLLVYENGKEVFRMPSAVEGEAAKATHADAGAKKATAGEVQRASALEPENVVELAPEVAEGSLLQRVEPEYPEEARQQRIQGAVVLDVRIGRDGAIQDVKLVSGQPVLASSAIAAVKQWRFKPRMLKGQPVEMQTRVTLNFRMPG